MKNSLISKKLYFVAILLLCILTVVGFFKLNNNSELTYPIVDTGVHTFYDDFFEINATALGTPFYGQDATYQGNEPSYKDNGDGTVTDNVTGLMWQKYMGEKITFNDAFIKANKMKLGGYNDWRVPSIKELYSLILFTGKGGPGGFQKYIDTVYFEQPFGDVSKGERIIDAQTWSSTQYKGLTFKGDSTVFGVNFIDGRIKGYPKYYPESNNTAPRKMYFRMVRGNTSYGINKFVDNGDGTVTDNATGLMWQRSDNGEGVNWKNALMYAENLTLANYSDWRLPNAKELQSIVDYTRSPSFTGTAAIDPVFNVTSINDPMGKPGHYPNYWTGTTHLDGASPYSNAVYVSFGKAYGKMFGFLMDVHGAGAQRSDPKTGKESYYPQYRGPQGDALIVYNYVRCVRN